MLARALVAQEQVHNRAMHTDMVALSGFAITVQMALVTDNHVRACWVSRAGDQEETLPVEQMSLSCDVQIGSAGARASARPGARSCLGGIMVALSVAISGLAEYSFT